MVQISDEIRLWLDKIAEVWPEMEITVLQSTDSTNNWLRAHREETSGRTMLVITDCQTAGRGSGSNHWESEPGCNLTFSMQVCPTALQANHVFALSEAMSLGVCMGLRQLMTEQDGQASAAFRIKWPNDVYHANGKVCGMLIENDLQSRWVERSVIGVGINVNQNCFLSDAPNPLSLSQIIGKKASRMQVLAAVLSRFRNCFIMLEQGDFAGLHELYMNYVYRLHEWHRFIDKDGTFEGCITNICPDGHLLLIDSGGQRRIYAFGEIKYII